MKKLPKSLTTVTTFSKLLALLLFILFPIVGFYLGASFQHKVDHPGINTDNENTGPVIITATPFPTPTTPDFRTWKQYQNSTYHYSLVSSSPPESEDITNNPRKGLINLTYYSYTKGLSLIIWKGYGLPITTKQQFKDWCHKSYTDVDTTSNDLVVAGYECPQPSDLVLKQITVDGQTAFEFPEWGIRTIFIPHDGYVYELLFAANMGYYDAAEAAQDLTAASFTLSTFKFLD